MDKTQFIDSDTQRKIDAPLNSTLISGTHRMCDLIPVMLAAIRDTVEYAQLHDRLPSVVTDPVASEWDDRWNDADVIYLYEDLTDILERYAPEGYYFGTHPGDGSDFGYWRDDSYMLRVISESVNEGQTLILDKDPALTHRPSYSGEPTIINAYQIVRHKEDVMVGNKTHMVNINDLDEDSVLILFNAVKATMNNNISKQIFSELSDEQWKKMEAVGYPYATGQARGDGLPTIPESIYWRVAAGIFSLEDATRVFSSTGFTNGEDPARTHEILIMFNKNYGKLDSDLRPLPTISQEENGSKHLSPNNNNVNNSQSARVDFCKQIFDKYYQLPDEYVDDLYGRDDVIRHSPNIWIAGMNKFMNREEKEQFFSFVEKDETLQPYRRDIILSAKDAYLEQKPLSEIQKAEQQAARRANVQQAMKDLNITPADIIQQLFDDFVKQHGEEPLYADVNIQFKKEEFPELAEIKLSKDVDERDDKYIFYNADGIEGLKKLTNPDNGEDFYIVDVQDITFQPKSMHLSAEQIDDSEQRLLDFLHKNFPGRNDVVHLSNHISFVDANGESYEVTGIELPTDDSETYSVQLQDARNREADDYDYIELHSFGNFEKILAALQAGHEHKLSTSEMQVVVGHMTRLRGALVSTDDSNNSLAHKLKSIVIDGNVHDVDQIRDFSRQLLSDINKEGKQLLRHQWNDLEDLSGGSLRQAVYDMAYSMSDAQIRSIVFDNLGENESDVITVSEDKEKVTVSENGQNQEYTRVHGWTHDDPALIYNNTEIDVFFYDNETNTVENIDNEAGIDAYQNRDGFFLVRSEEYNEAYRQSEQHDIDSISDDIHSYANDLGIEHYPIGLKDKISVDLFNIDINDDGESKTLKFASVEKNCIQVYDSIKDIFEPYTGYNLEDFPTDIQLEVVKRLCDYLEADNDKLTLVYNKAEVPTDALLNVLNGSYFRDEYPGCKFILDDSSRGYSCNPAFREQPTAIVYILKDITPNELMEEKKLQEFNEAKAKLFDAIMEAKKDLGDEISITPTEITENGSKNVITEILPDFESPFEDQNIIGGVSHLKDEDCVHNLALCLENVNDTEVLGKAVHEAHVKHLEQDAKQAIHDRIVTPSARRFTSDQVEVLNRYHQVAAQDKPAGEVFKELLQEVSQEPDVARKPEKWVTDTAKELNDLAEGITRDQSRGINIK